MNREQAENLLDAYVDMSIVCGSGQKKALDALREVILDAMTEPKVTWSPATYPVYAPNTMDEGITVPLERTCRNVAEYDDKEHEFICSECGYEVAPYEYGPEAGEHCKGCGARVVE